MKLIITTLLFVFSGLALSTEPVKLDTTHPSIKNFELHEVCEAQGLKHILLAEAVGTSQVDCMGKTVGVTEFCKKKFPESKNLLRGFINYQKMATCHFADNLILSIDCEKFPNYCNNPKRGCRALKTIYAVTLDVDHSGKVFSDEGTRLKCYFVSPSLEQIDSSFQF